MASELHTFITGPFLLKLRSDVLDLRVFSRQDLFAAAYFHIRRLLLVRAGWSCRADTSAPAALVLHARGEFRGMVQLESLLRSGTDGYFPVEQLDERMGQLRRTLAVRKAKPTARGYLVGAFDTTESWFLPEEERSDAQTCHWLPINCREFPHYHDWRSRWNRLVGS